MKSDEDVRNDVESELRWDPSLDATDIVVTVNHGAVTLAGFVKSFTEKCSYTFIRRSFFISR